MVSIGDHVQQGDVLVTLDNFARNSDGSDVARAMQGRIVAPDSGIISAANANVGSMSQPGVELFRLIRKGRLEWRAELTAEELMLMRKGMIAEITVGEGHRHQGYCACDFAVGEFADTLRLCAGHACRIVTGIIAGAYAHGTFDVSGGKRTLQSLPQSAVMQRGSMTYVLVVGADNHVHERTVKTGQRMGDRIEIKQGLQANEPVVESGGPFLTEGDVVQVVKG